MNSWVSCVLTVLPWNQTQANRFVVRRANHRIIKALYMHLQGVGSRHLPSGGILQERCCRLSDFLCLLFPVPLVSHLHESSCSLHSKDSLYYYLHNIMQTLHFYTLQLKILKIGSQHPVQEFLSGEGTTNVPRSDCSFDNDLECLDTSSYTFSLDFCNIRCLRSNFQSVEHSLSSIKPHLLFLTETQLSVTTDSSPFSVPCYFLYPHFQSKAGCCTYVCNNITCSRAHNLEFSEFSTIWLRLQWHSLTKYTCAVYFSPNSSDYVKFFDYLTSKVEYILSHFPYAEILWQ